MNTTRSAALLAITLLIGTTWGMAGVPKLLGGGVPPWFEETFGQTFLSSFPGMWASFYSIALLETLLALGAIGALLRGEFLAGRTPSWLAATLAGSLFAFLQLGFGKRLIADHDDAAKLFLYFAGTLVMLWYVTSSGAERRS